MKLNIKARTIIGIALFCVVFVALLLVATFWDLEISQLLTKHALDKGEYFAHDFYGVLLECVGCIPIFLIIAFALCVLFWSSLRIVREKNKALGIVLAVVCAIGVVAACWYTVKDVMKYVFEHVGASVMEANNGDNARSILESIDNLRHTPALYGIEVVLGALIAAPSILVTKLFDRQTLVKLLRFIIAAGVAIAFANLIIMIVKDPVGRMRFRAINSDIGQDFIASGKANGFTRWYVLNKQPAKEVLEKFSLIYGVDDAFKSFPSGHTCSAGTLYALIMIPDLFDFKAKNKKGATLACWIVPIVYTMLVAISRIVVGAHYMSDVLFGGTLAFVSVMLMREIFILKGEHFFALFPRKAAAGANGAELDATAETASADEITEETCAEERVIAETDTAEEVTTENSENGVSGEGETAQDLNTSLEEEEISSEGADAAPEEGV